MRSLSLSVFLMASAAMLAPLLVALAYTASVLASALMFPRFFRAADSAQDRGFVISAVSLGNSCVIHAII